MAEEVKLLDKQIHGTLSCYAHTKCRCEICRENWRIYNKRRRLRNYSALRNGLEIKHGYYGYNYFGCRCDICREEAKKIREKSVGKEPPKHGTFASYSLYRCRCQTCKDFKTEYMRNYREIKRARVRAEKLSMPDV